MELTFALLLWGLRIAFLVLLYLFLIRAFRALHRALADERSADAARQIGLAALVVTRSHSGGPRVGARLPLRAVSSVGRDAANDVVLNDEAASAKHAVLTFADGEWWIVLAEGPAQAPRVHQLTWPVIAAGVFCATILTPRALSVLARLKSTFAFIGILLLISPLFPFVGREINGARIWVGITGVAQFEPW